MIPTITKFPISRLTALESLHYGYRSTPSSMEKWEERTDYLEIYEALVDNVAGKIAEWGGDQFLATIYPDRTPPDHEVYGVDKKNFNSDSYSVMGGAEFAIKTKALHDVKVYGTNGTFTKNDPKIFGSKRNNDLNVILTVTDVNLGYEWIPKKDDPYSGTSCPIMRLDNVWVEVCCVVKLGWLHEHNLFYDPDRKQPDKKTVIFDHGPYKRPSNVRSILQVIETECGGDRSRLWQI